MEGEAVIETLANKIRKIGSCVRPFVWKYLNHNIALRGFYAYDGIGLFRGKDAGK